MNTTNVQPVWPFEISDDWNVITWNPQAADAQNKVIVAIAKKTNS